MTSTRARHAIVTGTGGLGFQVALRLAREGWDVVIAGRSEAKGAEALAGIRAEAPDARIGFEILDLASLASVADFAGRLRDQGDPVDLLVNNAGIMSPPKRLLTKEGHELQFGVNYLGHFALTAGLLPLLQAAPSARVISVTSLAMHHAEADLEDIACERAYKPGVAYCRSKLFQAMFARELQRRSERSGWRLSSFAAHPGFAATNLFGADQGPKGVQQFLSKYFLGPLIGHSAEAGARPILFAATSAEAQPGALYGPRGLFEMKGPPGLCKYAKAVDDQQATARLWDMSEALTGLRLGDSA
ncbi:MAG: SDR family oxidoreductase [Novosphingobium sp.]